MAFCFTPAAIRLEEYIRNLDELAKMERSRFLTDFMVHAAAERYLQLAVESILDLGNHTRTVRHVRPEQRPA